MRATDLVVRCYAEQRNGHWEAYCIDLCLAVQAGTRDEAVYKLHQQLHDYVREALAGDDSEFAPQLLKRKAPLYYILRYNWLKFRDRCDYWKSRWDHLKNNTARHFKATMPVQPIGPSKPA